MNFVCKPLEKGRRGLACTDVFPSTVDFKGTPIRSDATKRRCDQKHRIHLVFKADLRDVPLREAKSISTPHDATLVSRVLARIFFVSTCSFPRYCAAKNIARQILARILPCPLALLPVTVWPKTQPAKNMPAATATIKLGALVTQRAANINRNWRKPRRYRSSSVWTESCTRLDQALTQF